ncbi:MAG: YceI family protein [Planctomycetota bacterium]
MSENTPGACARRLPVLVGAGIGGALGLVAIGLAIGPRLMHEEAPPQGPDPMALLRDDVATLRADHDRLTRGIGEGFTALANHLDEGAAERAGERQAESEGLSAKLTALERSQAQLRRELGALQASLARVERAAAAAPVQTESSPPSSGPVAAAPPTPEPAPPEPATPEPPARESPAQEPPAEPAAPKRKKRALFGFRLAGGGPDFTQRQRYELIGSLSRVGFDAKSTLHDFSGVTSKVSGWFTARLDREDAEARGEVEAEAGDLRTGIDGRDEEMRKHLETQAHPKLRFELRSFVPSRVDAAAHELEGVVKGVLQIHGVDREVTVQVRAKVDESRRLEVHGEVPLKMSDFKVEVPSVAGAIKVEDGIKVWLALRLRCMGPAR